MWLWLWVVVSGCSVLESCRNGCLHFPFEGAPVCLGVGSCAVL
jgi:hypothetical protein